MNKNFYFRFVKRFMSFNKLRPVDAMFVKINLPLYVKRKVTNVDSAKSGMVVFLYRCHHRCRIIKIYQIC